MEQFVSVPRFFRHGQGRQGSNLHHPHHQVSIFVVPFQDGVFPYPGTGPGKTRSKGGAELNTLYSIHCNAIRDRALLAACIADWAADMTGQGGFYFGITRKGRALNSVLLSLSLKTIRCAEGKI